MSSTPVPAGPWLDSDAARAIGPVEAVFEPGAQAVNAVCGAALTLAGIATVGFALLTFARVTDDFHLPAYLGGELTYPWAACGLLLASWVYAGWRVAKFQTYSRWRLLLGREGFAEWTPRGSTVVFWVELGRTWRVSGEAGKVPGHLLCVLLTLRSSDRTCWRLLDLYAQGEQIRQRIEAQLLYWQLGTTRPWLPDQPSGPPLQPPEPGPWLECEAVWQIEPIEQVSRLTGWSEFVVSFCKPALVSYGSWLVALALFGPILVAFRENLAVYVPAGVCLLALGGGSAWYLFHRQTWTDAIWVRLILGAGGLVVYLRERQWLFRWESLAREGAEVAEVLPDRRAAVFTRLLLARINRERTEMDSAVFFRDTDRVVARLLDELRLRALVPPEPTTTPPRHGLRSEAEDCP